MATAPAQYLSRPTNNILTERWFFPGIAFTMIAICSLGFVPALAHPIERNAPLTALAAAHGIVFFAWLLLFLVQSSLISTRHVAWHRLLGIVSVFLLALMIPSTYTMTIAMVRRGYDLSGDLHVHNDPAYDAVFPFANLLIFTVLVVAALVYRRRPELHKRLMLFANIELMPAPLAHLIGHRPWLAVLPPAIVMVPITAFVLAAIARDILVKRRVHPLTWALASLRMVSGPLEAGPIGTSAAWHTFVAWLAQ